MISKKLSESELEIMLAIWKSEQPVDSSYLKEALKEKKWVQSTILNFLYRLVDKGYLKCEKEGRVNIYTPLIREEDYLKKSSKGFLKKLYGNSIKNMVAELYNADAITAEDFEELKQFIEEQSKKKVE